VLICLNNYLGNDDKNLLLFFTSPPLWLLEGYSSILRMYFGNTGFFVFWYAIDMGFWYLIGVLLDRTIRIYKVSIGEDRWTRILKITRRVVLALILFLSLVVIQYLRPTISLQEAMAIAGAHINKPDCSVPTVEDFYYRENYGYAGTTILSNSFWVVVTGKRYWIIGGEDPNDPYIFINAYTGRVIKVVPKAVGLGAIY